MLRITSFIYSFLSTAFVFGFLCVALRQALLSAMQGAAYFFFILLLRRALPGGISTDIFGDFSSAAGEDGWGMRESKGVVSRSGGGKGGRGSHALGGEGGREGKSKGGKERDERRERQKDEGMEGWEVGALHKPLKKNKK